MDARAVETAIPEQPAPLLKACTQACARKAPTSAERYGRLARTGRGVGQSDRPPAKRGRSCRSVPCHSPNIGGPLNERLAFALLDGLAQGIRSRGTSLADFAAQPDAAASGLKSEVEHWFARAASIAGDARRRSRAAQGSGQLLAYALTRLPNRRWSNCSCSRTRICGYWPWPAGGATRSEAVGRCCWTTWRGKRLRVACDSRSAAEPAATDQPAVG